MNKIIETHSFFFDNNSRTEYNFLHSPSYVRYRYVLIFEPRLSETNVLFVLFLVNYCSLNRVNAAKHTQKELAILCLLFISRLSVNSEAQQQL